MVQVQLQLQEVNNQTHTGEKNDFLQKHLSEILGGSSYDIVCLQRTDDSILDKFWTSLLLYRPKFVHRPCNRLAVSD